MFDRQTHHFRGLGAARDAEDAQQGSLCGTLSSHWPLWFCLQIWVCCWEPCVSNSSCEGAILRESSSFSILLFSRVGCRKRHEKRAAGHSLLHNLIALACMVQSATLNMQLGALRDSCSHANGHTVWHSTVWPSPHYMVLFLLFEMFAAARHTHTYTYTYIQNSCCLRSLPLRATRTHWLMLLLLLLKK